MSFSKKVWFLFIFLVLCSCMGLGQDSAGSNAPIEPRFIIDLPTAGILHANTIALNTEFFDQGGMLVGVSLGLFDRLMFGLSYGANGIIGNGSTDWNPRPGFAFKVRVLDETFMLPAIAAGFDSQGKEAYLHDASRYTIKSPGFFVALSKNYEAFGYLSFHGGMNYSLERADNDKDPNLFAGLEKSIGPFASVLAEYNLGWNDSNHDARGKGRGYFNTGIAISAWNGVTLKLFLKDLFRNQQDMSIGSRVFSIDFVNPI